MTETLSEAYRRTMALEEGSPDPDGSFDEIGATDFPRLWERWDRMRGVMRVDLGRGPCPTQPSHVGLMTAASRTSDGP